MGTKDSADLTTRVLVEIREELKGHRAEFVEIREELKGHRAEFVEIRDELKGHRAQFVGLGATLSQILRAVEHGNTQRDERVLDHEARISRLEERITAHP